jgi:hypothetical protein
MSSDGTSTDDRIKAFGMTNQLLAGDLSQLEREYDVGLGHTITSANEKDDAYYPQFERRIRIEASRMAAHYEIFYCLEKSIRALIGDTLEDKHGAVWWDSGKVPQAIHIEVAKRIKKELDSGMTRRSMDAIDYTTFGELSGIIATNWEIFGAMFSSPKAVEKVLGNLNSLRGPIAHCSPLAEDEVLRLQLSVRDWFRLME